MSRSDEPTERADARSGFGDFARRVGDAWSGRRGLVVLRAPASTHRLGRAAADEYGREGTIVPAADFLAWSQSAGHGREGRAWASPPGGVYATLVRAGGGPDVQLLPLAVATALADEVDRALSASRCRLKWPNDLLVSGRKIGGLLIDVTSGRASGTIREGEDDRRAPRRAVVVSFGVNVETDLEALPRGLEATTVARERGAEGHSVDVVDVAWRLVEAVDAVLRRALASESEPSEPLDPSATVEAYRARTLHRAGDRLEVVHGEETLRGAFRGIDDRGFLRLEVDGVERTIASGAITDSSTVDEAAS